MSEEFICYAEDKVYEPEGDLQPITICSDCYYRMSKADEDERNYKNGYETSLLMLDEKNIEIDTLRKQLEVALTDLSDTTAQLVMDEEVEATLRKQLEIALANWQKVLDYEYTYGGVKELARITLAEIERIGGKE
jgi:hypothetical protein